jgi:hypothetical protein
MRVHCGSLASIALRSGRAARKEGAAIMRADLHSGSRAGLIVAVTYAHKRPPSGGRRQATCRSTV